MTQDAPLLDIRHVGKRYGNVVALHSADLRVDRGQIHALLGANGAGKSTLVKILAGVVPADSGEVIIEGRPLRPEGPRGSKKAGVATVFQDPALVPHLTVNSNLRLTGVEPVTVRKWLGELGIKELDLDVLAQDLPLPTLRLLDLARALAGEPALLVLDEITAALPADQSHKVFDLMQRWRQEGNSVLFITHRLSEVLRVCDRATVLRDGRSVETLVPGEGGERRLVEAMLGETLVHELRALPSTPVARDPGEQVLLEVRDLRVPGHLDGIDFELGSGEVLGLVALEGQGQDRLFDVLAGDRPFAAGAVVVKGENLRPKSPYDAIRRGVVLVPSDRQLALLPQRPIGENLASTLYNRVSRWFSLLSDEEERIGRVIDRLAVDTRAHRQARRLSGGNQQKLAVGRWLTAGFDVLLCFDPTRGIDVGTKQQIYGLMRELAADGVAVLYYTSELAEIPLVCDRVMVMYAGRIVHTQPAAGADEATLLGAAHGLSEAPA